MRGQPAEVQEFLRALGRVDAAEIAARTGILGAFAAGQELDAAYTPDPPGF